MWFVGDCMYPGFTLQGWIPSGPPRYQKKKNYKGILGPYTPYPPSGFTRVAEIIQPCLNGHQSSPLEADVTDSEIKTALFSTRDDKDLEPDGYC